MWSQHPKSSEEKCIRDGFVIIDKPPKMICHEVTSWVKKILCSEKSGHAGTLDPQVTGVLPIGLGPSTKLLRFISGKKKTYVSIALFPKNISKEEAEKIFSKFRGEIVQTPPKESAVVKKPRKRRIYRLDVLEVDGRKVLFLAEVQAGTYIRVLCKDMGAEMMELRRIKVGKIGEELAVTMQDLVDAAWLWREKNDSSWIRKIIIPPGKMMEMVMKKMIIKETAATNLRRGAQLMRPGILSIPQPFEKGEVLALYTSEDYSSFVGVVKALYSSEEIEKMEKGQIAKTLRIHPKQESF